MDDTKQQRSKIEREKFFPLLCVCMHLISHTTNNIYIKTTDYQTHTGEKRDIFETHFNYIFVFSISFRFLRLLLSIKNYFFHRTLSRVLYMFRTRDLKQSLVCLLSFDSRVKEENWEEKLFIFFFLNRIKFFFRTLKTELIYLVDYIYIHVYI